MAFRKVLKFLKTRIPAIIKIENSTIKNILNFVIKWMYGFGEGLMYYLIIRYVNKGIQN